VPVVVIDDARQARPLAEAILEAGLACVEVTLRTATALEAIREMKACSGLLVGAGTVLNSEQARAAVDGGAEFIVSPGSSRGLVDWCLERQVPVVPGCATPTEIQSALEAGIRLVKFFPAEPLGGVKMLSALASVFREMRFMPTGGITADNIADYLALKQVAACGGSWMVRTEWIRDQQFDEIKKEIKAAIDRLKRTGGRS